MEREGGWTKRGGRKTDMGERMERGRKDTERDEEGFTQRGERMERDERKDKTK